MGTYYVKDQIAGAGYKAQNNTQTIITDPDSVVRFQTELIAEHLAARDEEVAAGIPASKRQQRPKIDELPAIRASRSGSLRPGNRRDDTAARICAREIVSFKHPRISAIKLAVARSPVARIYCVCGDMDSWTRCVR